MARNGQVHVIWSKKSKWWEVKLDHFKGWLTWTIKKSEAIVIARRHAICLKCELVVHNKDGKISRKDSFGNDPRGIKG